MLAFSFTHHGSRRSAKRRDSGASERCECYIKERKPRGSSSEITGGELDAPLAVDFAP
jgi:hypothetical protein